MSDMQMKRNDALRRAMSPARMRDYGLSAALAEAAHSAAAEGQNWEDALCAIASEARGRGDYGQAAAAMNLAQMAESYDTPARIALFRQAMADFRQHLSTLPDAPKPLDLAFGPGRLSGWDFNPDTNIMATVIIIGGMSGWANSFLRMARAVTAKGMRCLLLDGPGQGVSRIDGGLRLQDGYVAAVSLVVDHLEATGSGAIGIWGNSMGGLFAAISARDEPRLSAACVNGAPVAMAFPAFRTGADQMAALLGAASVAEAEVLPQTRATFASLAFDGAVRPLPCPVLVCEGGADPLVALGEQAAFLQGNRHDSSRVLSWPDGEHVIYNHADDRNEQVTDWFAARLRA